jgi:hypothetical protein
MALPDLNVTGRAQNVLLAMANVATTQNPEYGQTPVGTLQVGISDEMKAGSELTISKNGHYRKGEIKYIPRATQSEVSDSIDCTTGTEDSYLVEDFILDIEKSIDIRLDMDTISVLEASASDMSGKFMREFNERIMRKMNAIRNSLNKACVDKIYTGFGAFYGGSDTQKQVKVIHAGATGIVAGAPVYEGLQTIKSDCSDIEMVGNPYIIGKGNFEKFNLLSTAGLQNSGIEGSFNAGYNFFVDKEVDVKGENDIIVAGQGAFQIYTFNRFAGNFAQNLGMLEEFTIPDPLIPNLTWDAKLEYDSCDRFWNLKLSISAGVFIMPTETYSAYDNLTGVNHLLSYKAISA